MLKSEEIQKQLDDLNDQRESLHKELLRQLAFETVQIVPVMILTDVGANGNVHRVMNGGNWAASILERGENINNQGNLASGSKPTIYLASSDGQWFNSKGEMIDGYLHYKPRNRNK